MKNLLSTEQSLRRSYKRRFAKSRIVIDFPCDPVEEVTDIDLEFGEQGRQLTILSFTRHPDDGDYDVLGIEVRAPEQDATAYDYRSATQFELKTASVELGASGLDLDDVRTPLAATINEVRFLEPMIDLYGFSGGPHIHRLVRVQGRNDHLVRGPNGLHQVVEITRAHLERSYTGEVESIAQKEYLPLDLASKPLLTAIPAGAFAAVVTDEHRRLFRRRFTASFDIAPSWLRDFLLVLATRLGGPELIPKLVEVTRAGPDPQRVLAISALAAITGWDARFDIHGTPRPVAAVAAEYVQECAGHALD